MSVLRPGLGPLGVPRSRKILAFVVLLLVSVPALADRRDQVAADRYNEGVALIKKRKYREGAAKIQEAIARGATEPNDEQGTETRYLARRYDPYYWLGVAQMELGLSDQALANFEKSETIIPAFRKSPPITEWREEYTDLLKRKKTLLATLEAALPTPAPGVPTRAPAIVSTLPTAVPTSAPSSQPLPTAVPTRISAVPVAPTASPLPSVPESPDRLALRNLREEWKSWLSDERLTSVARDPLGRAMRDLDQELAQPERDPRSGASKRQVEAARARFQTEIGPLLRARSLSLAVEALASRQWSEVDKYAERSRRADPNAAQPDLLLCVANATRFILEGRKDALRLEEARKFLRGWKSKVVPGTPIPRFLSPALRAILS